MKIINIIYALFFIINLSLTVYQLHFLRNKTRCSIKFTKRTLNQECENDNSCNLSLKLNCISKVCK